MSLWSWCWSPLGVMGTDQWGAMSYKAASETLLHSHPQARLAEELSVPRSQVLVRFLQSSAAGEGSCP